MVKHHDVKESDNNSKLDWREDLMGTKFTLLVAKNSWTCWKLESMWDWLLRLLEAGQNRIELNKGYGGLIYSALYRAGPGQRNSKQGDWQEVWRYRASQKLNACLWSYLSQWKMALFAIVTTSPIWKTATTCDSYPILRMDDCIDILVEAKVVFTKNSNGGYWQVKIAGEDQDKTAFEWHHGLLCLKCMPLK